MDTLSMARELIGHTLAYHIIIVAFSIGLPVLMSLFEWRAWRNNSERDRGFVKLLSRWAAVFVIGGVFTGTSVALQLSTLWAPFLVEVKPTVGVLFQLEGYMFLVEAIFLSWYLATIRQVGTLRHFLIGLPISIGTIGSAFFITSVNAYMNNPSAMFTYTSFLEFSHSVTSYFFATTMIVLGYLAWRSLRTQTKPALRYLQRSMGTLGIFAGVLLLVLAFLGHQSAVDIATSQPHKLAAIEILDKTQRNAPMRIGGEINAEGEAEGGIVLPGVLSFLVGMNTETEVKGLNEVPEYKWPPLIVHLLFDIKMILVGLSALTVVLVAWFHWRRGSQPRWMRKALIPLGTIGFVMMELGWLITEFGRQTWTVVGKLTTAQAMTAGANIRGTQYVFIALFAVMTVATLFALTYTTRHWRDTEKQSW